MLGGNDTSEQGVENRLQYGAETLGLNLSALQCKQLVDYIKLLQKWNTAYNLSAIKDESGILVKHVFDCLAIVKPVQNLLSAQPVAQRSILDVGTGAGLPGLILAICLPDVQVTLLDAIQKKITFIQHCIGQLKLTNTNASATRIQDWRGQYSVITARAWTSLGDIPSLCTHVVMPQGCIAAMKGPRASLEAQNLPTGWAIEHALELTVPDLNEPRSLVILRAV